MTTYPTVEIPPPHPHRRLLIVAIAAIAGLILVVPLVLYLALRGGSGRPSANLTAGPAPTASATPGIPAKPGFE